MAHPKRVKLEWIHPKREVTEILCNRHERQVLLALRILDIGCVGQQADENVACTRCEAEAKGQEPRFAIDPTG